MRKINFTLNTSLLRCHPTRMYSIQNVLKKTVKEHEANLLKSMQNPHMKVKFSYSKKWILPLCIGAGIGLMTYLSSKEVIPNFDYEKINERHYRLSDEVKL